MHWAAHAGPGYAMGTYLLGRKISEVSGPTGIAIGVLTVIGLLGSGLFLHKNEKHLTQLALAEEKKPRIPAAKHHFSRLKGCSIHSGRLFWMIL